MTTGEVLKTLLTIAWLLPLAGFAIEIFAGYWQKNRFSMAAAKMSVICIGMSFIFSLLALIQWGLATDWTALAATEHHGDHAAAVHHEEAGNHAKAHEPHGKEEHANTDHHEKTAHHDKDEHEEKHAVVPSTFSGRFYTLADFGKLKLSLDYYIDSLTLIMFTMVTLIATCIHIFAMGYMSDELTNDYVDHQAHKSDGSHVHRPGRYYQFFAFLSLFCFSMLGLVLAGNIFQVFVFWELVGICSYLLIGFYTERKTANVAANKAFIMNRVGDFGFLIGLMVIWTWFGTFSFTTSELNGHDIPGIFEMVRGNDGAISLTEDGNSMIFRDGEGHALKNEDGSNRTIPYTLLVVAGLGVFGGCIGKSAQFPLQTWLPDAMEGPTPVSALVHSATMVAAGVYLTGRFYPVFTPEVLLTIAYIGCITLFVAATIAVVATDIKRVLAYSTISQLGYMMLAIGISGWVAGLFHLITHAFFKSLMFLCSGSVIHGCHHEQEMPKMGGLLKKMPVTALTMLVGVIAISGLAIPFTIFGMKFAFSGYHSKDAIVATGLAYMRLNPSHIFLFFVPLVTAGITAFYMFRLWFYTFLGRPRDQEMHDHVHESPRIMTVPLLVLALFAAGCAIGGESGFLYKMLIHSEPAGVAEGVEAFAPAMLTLPSHHHIHAVHSEAGIYALIAAVTGMIIAYILYATPLVDPGEIKRQFSGLHHFLVEKWHFDTLYDAMFVKPMHIVASWCSAIDKKLFDSILHGFCAVAVKIARFDRQFDEKIVDGLVETLGDVTFSVGRSLKVLQTGKLRQYIMFIAASVVVLFILAFVLFPSI